MDGDSVMVSTKLGSIKFDIRGGKAWPSSASGVYKELLASEKILNKEFPELDDIEQYFKERGMEFLFIPVKIPTGPDALVLYNDSVYGVEIEVRNNAVEKYDDIRVPVRKVMPIKLALWPMEYYISVSKSGKVFITEYRKILYNLMARNVYFNGAKTLGEAKKEMYIKVPKKDWHMVNVRTYRVNS